MANYTTIEAEAREHAGKGAARATRRQGKVPAVIYGANQPPGLLALDPRVVLREVHATGWRSRIYEVNINGAPVRALMRAVQFHPVTDKPEHVDFQRLAPGEKVRVAVTVQFRNEGISPGMKRGGVLNVVRHAVECYCDPENVPPHFDADLAELDINDNIRWHDLKGTEGIRPVIIDRDFVIATVAPPTKIVEAAAETTTAAATPVAGRGGGGSGGGRGGGGSGGRCGPRGGAGEGQPGRREEEVAAGRASPDRKKVLGHAALGRARQPRARDGAPASQYRLHGARRDRDPLPLLAVAAAVQGRGGRGRGRRRSAKVLGLKPLTDMNDSRRKRAGGGVVLQVGPRRHNRLPRRSSTLGAR